MSASPNTHRRSARRWPLASVVLVLVLAVAAGHWLVGTARLWGQPAGAEQLDPAPADADGRPGGSEEPVEPLGGRTAEAVDEAVQTPAHVTPLERPFETGMLQRLDAFFERVVAGMARVLFARIGARDRHYIQFDDQTHYLRPAESDEPLVRLEVGGQLGEQRLTESEVRRLELTGRLVPGPDGEPIRRGEHRRQLVEFVAVRAEAPRYVWHDGEFRRQLPLRQLLDPHDVLTPDEAHTAAAQGMLELDMDRWAAGDPRPYLLVERNVGGAPLVVLWLALGAVFFTVYMRGFNVWGFRHSLAVIRGKYDNPDEPGEVSHFQALSSALSATVGLGNIAGVTIAMAAGGPGAFFWMMACGVFGMSSKFVECTLGQKYREVKPDGTVLGGPMQYLHHGLKELGLGPLGLVLAIAFAVMCILASFGGGNMFQANQSGQQVLAVLQMDEFERLEEVNRQIRQAAEAGDDAALDRLEQQRVELRAGIDRFGNVFLPVFGLIMAAFVAIVIIGGIKRIGAATAKIVPSMCAVYLLACIWIIGLHFAEVPELVLKIFTEAFRPEAFGGGLLGVLVIGVQRAAFSNEAGVGSAAIAHSAARTKEPVREGAVALMEPFIDTVVVCSMTALVILITGAWTNYEWIVEQGRMGTQLTSRAFREEISWFPYVLMVAVVLFAYSTMISWSYYGERCWERLFGARSTIVYRVLYVGAVFVGAVVNLGAVLDFSDMMLLSMAFPNILGLILLSPLVRRELLDYWRRHQAGEF